jgi:uroporphyrinogen decarboxylase
MDHWQRIEAAIAGEATDRVPVALWKHFPGDDQDASKLAARTIEWQRTWEFDLVKFMPSGTYGVEDWGAQTAYQDAANGARVVIEPGVRRPTDWLWLPRLDVRRGVLGAQNKALALAAKVLRGRVPILQTVFSPLTTARKLAGESVFEHLRRHPGDLEAGLRTITDTTVDFALAALDAGAHGVFFATQLASRDALSTAEYERFGARYDLEVFAAIKGRARFNLLHLHGENVMFERLAAYPVQMLNWHDRLTPPALAAGAKQFGGALVGGVEERTLLVTGPGKAIRTQVRDAIAQTGGRRLIVGPGCVVAVAAPAENIRIVIEEARRPS